LRHTTPALSVGAYQPMRSRREILCFKRCLAGETFMIALNCSHDPRRLEIDGNARLVLSTSLDREGDAISGATILRADEGVILKA
jgi:alpha-glucosidase